MLDKWNRFLFLQCLKDQRGFVRPAYSRVHRVESTARTSDAGLQWARSTISLNFFPSVLERGCVRPVCCCILREGGSSLESTARTYDAGLVGTIEGRSKRIPAVLERITRGVYAFTARILFHYTRRGLPTARTFDAGYSITAHPRTSVLRSQNLFSRRSLRRRSSQCGHRPVCKATPKAFLLFR